MSANVSPQVDALPQAREARNVREIIAVCAKHNVPCGTPDDFAPFLRVLDQNKHLAMDFWSTIARLTRMDTGTSSPDWLLATVVEGVTGQTVAEVSAAGPQEKLLVEQLARMIAGEDVPGPDLRFAPEPEAKPRPAARSSKRADFTPITNPAWLNDRTLHPEPEPPLRTAPNPGVAEPDDAPRLVISLAEYADRSSEPILPRRLLAAGLLLALVACGVWIAHTRKAAWAGKAGASIHADYAATIAALKGHHAQSPPSGPQMVTPPVVNSTPATSPATESASTPAATPAAGDPTAAAAAPQPASARETAPVTHSKPAQPIAAAPPMRNYDVPLVAAEQSQHPEAASTAPRVVVPEAVMRRNLASSRVPVVPAEARAAGGLVVMQAVVNSDGSVGHLHVLSGDPALRRAATDAVSTWHYRPYLLNGQPVDVSTTISVDFTGND